MPELVIVTFDSEDGAERARASLRRLPREQMALIEEALTVTDGGAESLGLRQMRQQPSRLISMPRSLLATAFTGFCKVTAWTFVVVGTIGGATIRGVQRIDGKSVKQIEQRLESAKSTLLLITNGGIPVDLVESFSDQDVDVMHATISSDNAEVLRRHMQP